MGHGSRAHHGPQRTPWATVRALTTAHFPQRHGNGKRHIRFTAEAAAYPPATRPSAPQGAPHSTCARRRMSSPLRRQDSLSPFGDKILLAPTSAETRSQSNKVPFAFQSLKSIDTAPPRPRLFSLSPLHPVPRPLPPGNRLRVKPCDIDRRPRRPSSPAPCVDRPRPGIMPPPWPPSATAFTASTITVSPPLIMLRARLKSLNVFGPPRFWTGEHH